MKRAYRNGIAIFSLGLLAVGCASVSEQKLGDPAKSGSKFQVKLEGKGYLLVAQRLAPRAKCSAAKSALVASVQGEAGTPPVALVSTCELIKGQVALLSKEELRPGTYSVQIKKGEGANLLVDRPVVSAKYDDPDFNSGADFIPDGAKDLASGQVSKGAISYASGNTTDWVKVSGKGGAVALTFLDGSDQKNLTAYVYDLSKGARSPRFLGALSHKKTRSFPLKSGKLYVRIKGDLYLGEGNYSLIRGDSASPAVAAAAGDSARLSVIDCYQVGEGESVVLLEAGEGVKVSDEVVVFGKKGAGELIQLGECEVTAVQGTQASCKMNGSVDSRYTEFKAVTKPRS